MIEQAAMKTRHGVLAEHQGEGAFVAARGAGIATLGKTLGSVQR